MCGRFTNRYSWSEIAALYRATEPWIGPPSNLPPRYNIAPMQRVLCLRAADGARRPFMAQWSLTPFLPKPKLSTFNATIEKLVGAKKSPIFDRAWSRGQRCLVPADGWYEWPAVKQPRYFTRAGGAPFAFAGLWDTCPKGDGEDLVSCTIVTVPPNEYVGSFHDRAPAVLTPENFAAWLDAPTPADAAQLCVPYAGADLESWRVAPEVGNWRNEGPDLIAQAGDG